MNIVTEFNIGDEVYTIDYVGFGWVVEKEKYVVQGIKAILEYNELKVEYISYTHRRYFIAFATKEEAQAECDRRNNGNKN